jgi:PTH1 family peptidyl-tRNA hydrolase
LVFFVKKENVDVIFVGLGNPGAEYERTKHNVGFRVIESFSAQHLSRQGFRKQLGALVQRGNVNSHEILLAKPQSYMNISGPPVKWLSSKYPCEEIVVIYDDLDIPPGRIRLTTSGGSAGHNGMQSIMESLDKDDIKRIRIGIGGRGDMAGADYVLTPFMGLDAERVENAIGLAVKAMIEILENGFEKTMNTYNRKDVDEFLTERDQEKKSMRDCRLVSLKMGRIIRKNESLERKLD